jgi:hypothetical protein
MGSPFRTDWKALRRNMRPILLLALGCVLFAAFAIGWVATWLVPEMPWAAAIALAASLALPDSVAAAALRRRLNRPRRIVTVREGESLVNDASGLVLHRLAIVRAWAWGQDGPWRRRRCGRALAGLHRRALPALHAVAEVALTKLSQELDFEENRLRRALG